MYFTSASQKPTILNYMEGKEHQIPSNIHFAYIFEARNKKNQNLSIKERGNICPQASFQVLMSPMKANLISINQNLYYRHSRIMSSIMKDFSR